MPSFLCMSVTFLDPAFHGRRDGGNPEWPPSPLRLFQALVAAAAARWGDRQRLDHARPALQWLEAQLPPSIVAPLGQIGGSYRLSVPNNAMDLVARAWSRGNTSGSGDANPATHRAMKSVRPTRLIDGDTISYLWQLPQNPPDEVLAHIQLLRTTTRHLVALGWGIDLVAANGQVLNAEQAATLPGEHWQPGHGSDSNILRVPKTGTLAALESRHKRFLNRVTADGLVPVPPLTAFQSVGYRPQSAPATRPFVSFKLMHPGAETMRFFPATRSVALAGMIRHAVAEAARPSGRTEEWINQFILGHRPDGDDPSPRFSYLPLPTIDPRNVASGIRRVLIAEPHGASGDQVAWINRILGGSIVTNADKHPVAVLAPCATDGVVSRYQRSAHTWVTATPVALPGCDDGKPKKRERLFFKALTHAGYSPDALAVVEFQRTPFLRGAEYSLSYRPGRPHYLQACSVYHIRLSWKSLVTGPIAIGSGRHCGLGIFAALD